MMDPIVDAYEAEVARIRLSPPRIPLLSTVTADWLSDEDAVNPAYWARQLRLPVRFADAVQALWRRDDFLMLELGPRATATTMARRAAWDRPRQIAVPSMGDGIASEQSSLLGAAGHLWACGAALDLEAVIPKEPPASLPGYPFARVRHWIEPHQPAPHTTTAPGSSDELAALQALLAAQRVVLQTQANLLRRQNVLTSDQRIAEQ
jgi:acyl transferase domain-containing protein